MNKTRDESTDVTDEARPRNAVAKPPPNLISFEGKTLQNAILNSVNFAIIATDASGIIKLFNIGAERLLGYAASDLINKKMPSDLHDPQEVAARAAGLSAELAVTVTPGFGALAYKASRGIEDKYELTYIRKDRSRFPAEVSITALRNDETEIIGYLLIGTDNSTAHIANTETIRIGRMKDEFVATVSDELRTPLTSIVATLGLLSSKTAGKLVDQAPRLLTIAYANSQRLVRLLNDILDIEKLESGKASFNFIRVEVLPVVEEAIEEIQTFAKDHNVRIRLGSTSAATHVRADADRLMQVITNLLSNAVKFSPPGEEVVVALEMRGECVRISVRDHGIGISEEFKPRVFTKFAQADATDTRQKGGTGLGLSIVKQIVERLGGAVCFEDAPGGGTIFYVELPNWADAVKMQSRAHEISDLRVLLCEDNPEAAIVICDRLLQEGFATDVALTANDAIACVAAASYAAILVDLQLPEGDGISLVKQLRTQQQAYNTLLVVLSADLKQASDGNQPSTLLNILDWLETPIDVNRLVRVLNRPIVHNRSPRPRVLFVNSDEDALRAIAEALQAEAEVMSVGSIDEARRAIASKRFDVAVLDVALALGSGFDLLHELRDGEDNAIPLVVFSSPDVNSEFAARFRASVLKSRISIDNLVTALRKYLVGSPSSPIHKDAA